VGPVLPGAVNSHTRKKRRGSGVTKHRTARTAYTALLADANGG